MKTLLGVIGGMILAGLLTGGALLFIGMDKGGDANNKQIRSAAAAAMQAMSFNQEMQERLGVPIAQGEVTVQKSDFSLLGASSMSLNVLLTGPKGTGKLTANLVRNGPQSPWVLTNGSFFPTNGGPPIFIRPRPTEKNAPQGFMP